MNETVADQARTLSSGTIATLTGITNMRTLDTIQWMFVQYVEKWEAAKPGHFYKWQDAWRPFWEETIAYSLDDK